MPRMHTTPHGSPPPGAFHRPPPEGIFYRADGIQLLRTSFYVKLCQKNPSARHLPIPLRRLASVRQEPFRDRFFCNLSTASPLYNYYKYILFPDLYPRAIRVREKKRVPRHAFCTMHSGASRRLNENEKHRPTVDHSGHGWNCGIFLRGMFRQTGYLQKYRAGRGIPQRHRATGAGRIVGSRNQNHHRRRPARQGFLVGARHDLGLLAGIRQHRRTQQRPTVPLLPVLPFRLDIRHADGCHGSRQL